MEDSNPNISCLRRFFFFCIFAAVILLLEPKIVSVVADNDDAAGSSDSCNVNLSRFLPKPYHNNPKMVCTPVWNTFIMRFFQGENNVVTFIVSATYTTGWFGVGFSNTGMMVGSSAMVGWIGKKGKATIKQYFLQGFTESEVLADMGELDLTGAPPVIVLHASTIYMAFQLKVAAKVKQQSILLAVGSKIPVDNQLTEHDDRTSILFDLTAGNVSSSSESSEPNNLITGNHGVFGIVGSGMLLPAGAIIARYFRHHDPLWFHLHTIIQSVGFISMLAAVVTGHLLYERKQVDAAAHRANGIFVLVLGFLQVMAFFLRPGKDSKVRRYWNWYHIGVGRTALFFGSVNILFGLQVGGKGFIWRTGYGLLVALTLVTVIVLETFSILNKPRKTLPPAFKLDAIQ